MAKVYAGTYTSTILLTSSVQQNPATLTGSIVVNGTNASSDSGFYSNVPFAWSITNLGSISASGATSYGIALLAGGTIQNGAVGSGAGNIRSDETGVLITGAPATLTNDGSITGTLGRGVFLQDGGTLTNGATNATTASIIGGFVGVAIYNAGGVLNNAGTIADTGTAGLGVELYSGTVSNAASGHISGVYGLGFVGRSSTGTLTNAGSITGSTRDGVELSGGGSVINSGSIGGGIGGVLALYGAATISNTGTITGAYAGIDLLAGGTVGNLAGATVSGGFGVSFGNGTLTAPVGTLTNAGIVSGATYEGVSLAAGGGVVNSGSIYGRAAGVASFYGSASVTNTGTITAAFIGVDLRAGGTLSNAAGASISGSYGVVLSNGTATGQALPASGLTNTGRISGSGQFGVEMLTNGTIINQTGGSIMGGRYGVFINAVTGTLANYGVISGQIGVYTRAVVANNMRYPAMVTIINAGTITGTGGPAVSLYASNDLLIDKPGAVFNGGVLGGGARLELAAGVGALGTINAALLEFSSVTVDAGANWTLAGTLSSTATLTDYGTLTVSGGATFNDKGLIQSQGTATGTLRLSTNGTLALTGTLASNIQVAFADAHGHLSLTSPQTDFATQTGFAAGSSIILPNIVTTGLTETFTQGSGAPGTGGTLTLKQNGTAVANLLLRGNYSTASFALSTDPHGGTDITIPCFLAGTRIALAAGERRVERLRVGDMVLTGGGALRHIVWIGQRSVAVDSHAAPDSVRPVRIARDAFGPGRPRRDLLLSPDHAVLHEGVLIPVHLLINGRTILPQPCALARYYHVELASHDILLAEGLGVESYRDCGNRPQLGLAEAGPRRAEVASCAPLVLAGSALARARRHVLAQAGGRRRADPALTVLLQGAALTPARRQRDRLLYLLPPDAAQVTLLADKGWALAGAVLDGQLLDPRGPCYEAGFAPPCLDRRRITRGVMGRASLTLPNANGARRSLELIST